MYESPPPLKFPSLAILRRLTRSILSELSSEEIEVLHSKRGNLVFKQFGSGAGGAPSKRKPKVTNACQNCKKSKTGCDGYLPCENCSKRSKLCEYPPGVTPQPKLVSAIGTSGAAPVDPITKTATTKTTTQPLPTPTEPSELNPVSHDDMLPPPPPPPQPAFVIGRFSAQQQQQLPPPPTQQHYFPVPEAVTLVTENNVNNATSPPSSLQRQACTDRYGHFTGDTTFFIPQQSARLPAGPSSTFPQRPETPQFLSADIQTSLIDTFYAHANPFFPAIMNKAQMLAELNLLRTDQPSQLSQLFFHAVFSRAASLTSGEDFVQQDTPERKTWSSISDALIASAFEARDDYLESPHISTLLALVIIANHYEHNKLAKNLRRAWMLIGDAGRLAIDMGLHRASRLLLHPDGEGDVSTQMCIRAFWAVCVSERTMSITYGRPSMFDDKDIDVPPPKCLPEDDEQTQNWVESLRQLVTMSNIACRIMRFNYSAQTQFSGAFRFR
ncbi:fungal-specific transcription factor domain-containing protein [Zychaea mexicana]|uniref:fungal-specific transcription factor domain-containing protein n=1 Tax=Zychaea mexicana TaxID=64656 RepID=UPI0022FE6F04|nr:fungal-specific transcription factor domain-containing protein [Zychaea mexicana]KAI9492306.1 fungal-specific transcription factor domain-containing protein [Zychaea mexicana]